jgi:hypothetical protein
MTVANVGERNPRRIPWRGPVLFLLGYFGGLLALVEGLLWLL